jgi:hypothetical protein
VQLHPGSQLKFIPEEILVHGRDFRLLRVGFEAGGLEPQAFQVGSLFSLETWVPLCGNSNTPGSLSSFFLLLSSRRRENK